ncbi:MAG: hypothetical protein JKY37_22500 [Nannocystaceae bacterium]|nr:hypothetical protein [Nannocystaceae bacterium]
MLPLSQRRLGCSLSGYPFAEARHPLMQREIFDVQFDASIGGVVEDPPPVRYERTPTIDVDIPRSWSLRRRTWHLEQARRRTLARARGGQSYLLATKHRVAHGPVLGAGARFRGREVRPWLRGGWEFSTVQFLVHTVAVESDLRRISIVPSTEIGSRSLLLVPPLSVGVGVPVRLAPHVRPGARVFGGLNSRFVSLVGGYDVLPRMRGRPTEHVGFLGLQASL